MQHNKLPEAGSVAHWLRFAESDLFFARMPPSENLLAELLCFHAQQAAEKAIKAVLTYYNILVPRTHSIEKLIGQLKNIDIPQHVHSAAWLSDYASTTRYPGEWEPITHDEYLKVLDAAEKVVTWAKEICREKGDNPIPLG